MDYTVHLAVDAEDDREALALFEEIREHVARRFTITASHLTDTDDWAEHVTDHCNNTAGDVCEATEDLHSIGIGRRVCDYHEDKYRQETRAQMRAWQARRAVDVDPAAITVEEASRG